MAQFDKAARQYDRTFTHTCVGKAQRDQVWKLVHRYVVPKANHVVEINCGTGEDAQRWKQLGKHITATDLSPEMIAICRAKFHEIDFQELDITQLSDYNRAFDTLFSNFGGLNCLSPEQIRTFLADAHRKLPAGGQMALVIMGKKCLWDRMYMVFKGKWKQRNRRDTDAPVSVDVDGISVPTWYYAPNEIHHAASAHFRVIVKRPIGLFVPPSYLAPAFEARPRMFSVVRWLDSVFSFSALANQADHFLIVLERT